MPPLTTDHQNSSLENIKIYAMLIVATLFWGGHYTVVKLLHANLPPFTLACARWGSVFIILLPWVIGPLRRRKKLVLNNLPQLFIVSLLSTVIYTFLVYAGLQFTTAVNAALITGTSPILIMIIAHYLLGDPINRFKSLGITLSLMGVTLILTAGHPSSLLKLHFNKGDLYFLGAMVAWAGFTLQLRQLPKKIPVSIYLFVTSGLGTWLLLPAAIWELRHHPVTITTDTVIGIAYISLFASILAYGFWRRGIAAIGPAKAIHFSNLITVFTSMMAVIFLNEKIHFYHATGFLLVLSGIYLSNINDKRYKRTANLIAANPAGKSS